MTAQPDLPGNAATARYAAKKEAILGAATTILNRQGVKGMTLADVAAEVGLITTSVTYYYRRKEDLAAACFIRGIDIFNGLAVEAAAVTGARARLARFLALFFDLARRIRTREASPIVAFGEMRALKEPLRTEVSDAFNDLFRNIRGFFDDPEFAGLDRRDATARTHLLLEQAFWTWTWLPRYDIEDYPRLRERMFDILSGGLAVGARPWAPPTLPGPPQADPSSPDVSHETFLIAATRLINRKGYRGASVEDISAELNVTKGSFYHHNEAKDDLVAACFERTFGVMRDIQFAARDLKGDQWTRLAAASAALVEYQLSDSGPLLRASSMTALPVDLRYGTVERYNRISDRFAGMISDGIAEGSIRAVDPLVAAHMLSSMINAAASLSLWTPGLKPEEAAALFARPLLLGVFTR